MIFAELVYDEHYDALHEELRQFLAGHFPGLRSGLQSDSWFWIGEGSEKVAIDTFTSMNHQVKAARPGPHVQRVLDVLAQRYVLRVYDEPELEGHEEPEND